MHLPAHCFTSRRMLSPVMATALAAWVLVAAAPASARCPRDGSPSRAVCKYSHALLLPSGHARLYLPGGNGMGPWLGGGVELVLFTWSDNSERLGPGQGKIFFDIGALGASNAAAGTMIMYRGGANVSFERNASRSWLIPYFGFTFGGLHEATLDDHGFAEGLLGVHALYTPNLIIDLEGGYLFPFTNADVLAGEVVQVTVSFSRW